MSAFCGCSCSGGAAVSVASSKSLRHSVPLKRYSPVLPGDSIEAFPSKSSRKAFASLIVRASAVDSYENSSDFVKRMERAWLISQQPRPVACPSCASEGKVECRWCGGTGFFVIGNNVLCEVPSRNTSCVICAGKVKLLCNSGRRKRKSKRRRQRFNEVWQRCLSSGAEQRISLF